jgi:hypothetical protein
MGAQCNHIRVDSVGYEPEHQTKCGTRQITLLKCPSEGRNRQMACFSRTLRRSNSPTTYARTKLARKSRRAAWRIITKQLCGLFIPGGGVKNVGEVMWSEDTQSTEPRFEWRASQHVGSIYGYVVILTANRCTESSSNEHYSVPRRCIERVAPIGSLRIRNHINHSKEE